MVLGRNLDINISYTGSQSVKKAVAIGLSVDLHF